MSILSLTLSLYFIIRNKKTFIHFHIVRLPKRRNIFITKNLSWFSIYFSFKTILKFHFQPIYKPLIFNIFCLKKKERKYYGIATFSYFRTCAHVQCSYFYAHRKYKYELRNKEWFPLPLSSFPCSNILFIKICEEKAKY